jgi:hypothetical protein
MIMRFKWKKLRTSGWHLGVVLAIFATFPVTAVAQEPGGVILRPGIVIDPSTNIVYAMTPEGIAAVDVTSGAKRWTTKEAAKPLGLARNLLISQIEPKTETRVLNLAVLDTKESGAVTARGVDVLPETVKVAIGQTLEGKFESQVSMLANDALVTWRFESIPLRGVQVAPVRAPTTDSVSTLGAHAQSTEGALRLNLGTGAVSKVNMGSIPQAAREWVLTSQEKISGAPPRQYVSADRRHIMASERIADDKTWAKYRWTVFEKVTKKRIGQFLTHLSFVPFVVRNSILIYETTPYLRAGKAEPAKLRGVDLATGKEVWSVEVRELVYRGPVPP